MRCGYKNKNNTGYTATIATNFNILASVDKVDIAIWRRYGEATSSTDPETTNKVTSVKLYVSASKDFSNAIEYIADISALPAQADGTGTITIDVPQPKSSQYYKIAIELPNATNNGWLAVNTINFYGSLSADAIAAPTISCDDNNMVTITSSDAEASIYYTTNGDTPTASSTKYTAPFSITEDTTIKAIAVKGTAISGVNTFTAVYVPTYANFAEMKDGGADKVSKVTNLKVVYQNGQNLYLYDETNNGMRISEIMPPLLPVQPLLL